MSDYQSELKNISNIPKNIEIAIIQADFNKHYTDKLSEVSTQYLENQHFRKITKYSIPGALEIPAMLKRVLELGKYDLIYCFWDDFLSSYLWKYKTSRSTYQ